MYAQNEKIIPIYIEDEIKDSYLNYAMSVIVGRALPDLRDGLKPVHRRVLYAMKDLGLEHNKPFKKAARIVGECFVKDTLISTQYGLLSIQDIKRGDLVYTQKGLKRVAELYEMPPKELLKIKLGNGIYNTVTPLQKLKVLNAGFQFEWKEANTIKPGDYIVLKTQYPNIKKRVKLHKIHRQNPAYLNENIAYLLGIFMSEGWIEKNKQREDGYRINIACNSRLIIEKVADVLLAEFDYLANIESRPYAFQNTKGQTVTNCTYAIRVNKKYITKFLITNFGLSGLKAPTKNIPNQIFKSSESVIYAFVSGLLDGDGSLHNNRSVIHYGSVSEKLISQLQILLQHLGIFSARYIDDKCGSGGVVCGHKIAARRIFYNLEFKGINANLLASKIFLYDKEKKSRRLKILDKKLKKSNFEIIPYIQEAIFSELSQKHLGGGWYQAISGEKFRLGIKYGTGCKIRYSKDLKEKPLRKSQIVEWGIKDKLEKINSPLYDFISHVLKDNVYFMEVASIIKVASQTTYDIQVEDEHEFVANGMVSHNCLGKYHPHGDVAVYDSLVRMAQDFSLRYPLVTGQGNFGSIDGDSAAAMRYVEAKLASIADELLEDIEKETVNFVPNFDGSLVEPSVLPAKLPNLLINGSSGIAVGMATNIPPHNLKEVVDAIIYLLDNPICEIKELTKFVKGPDFPTGALICGKAGIKEACATGRGKILVRARATIEHQKNGKDLIVITEIPYQVNKTSLIENIVRLVEDKTVDGISDIRDESDREGMRIVVELKRDIEPQIILNHLYKHTALESTFGIINLALVNGRPRVLNLKQMLSGYIDHRKEIIRRRTQFELDRAQKRAHILEGLKIALKFIDQIIKTIKASKNTTDAKHALMKNFELSEIQAQAILEMQLQRLTALERDKLEAEYLELIKKIELYRSILASEKKIEAIIKEEITELGKKYGDERRTEIVGEAEDIEIEDLIAEEDMVITLSHSGYIKRIPVSAYRRQGRGGKGVTAMQTKEEDFVKHLFVASAKDYLLIFTNKGKAFWLKVYEIPQASRIAKGRPIVNLLQLTSAETISSVVAVKDFSEDKFLIMVTKYGIIKKTELSNFSNPRKGGIIAIGLEKDDLLIEASLTQAKDEILLATKEGKCIRFKESLVRSMGRSAKGVKAVNLAKKDQVIGMEIVPQDAKKREISLLTVTEGGFAKRTAFEEYRLQSRGGKGIINIKVTQKNGPVCAVASVGIADEVMTITQKGILIRCAVKDIREIGRNTQGVRLISLEKDDSVIGIAKVVAKEEE